jgi:hypothetical protein
MSKGRKYYSASEWNAQLATQGGLCAAPGCTSTGPFDADHEIPNAWEPGKPTQLLCKPCHKEKTKRDAKRIAKAERQAGRKGQWKRRISRGFSLLSGRGFDRTKTKRFDGKVVPRG